MSSLTFFQPNPGPDAPCPLCNAPRPHSPRYPDNVCADCVARAVDETGRRLEFNTALNGGIRAKYADSGEQRESHDCFIDGVRCRADEAYFGGVVVRPAGPGGERGSA
jgi:hypothetical protein